MVKGVKARRKGRRWNKTIGILLCITAMGTIITLSALNQKRSLPPPPTPKEPANEYFIFSQVAAVGDALDSQNTSIQVSSVGFKITPIGGNATNVYVYPRQGGVPQEETPRFDEIINGTSIQVGPVQYQYKVVTEKEEGEGWPLLFQITSNEAEGEVTVYVTEFFPIPSSGP